MTRRIFQGVRRVRCHVWIQTQLYNSIPFLPCIWSSTKGLRWGPDIMLQRSSCYPWEFRPFWTQNLFWTMWDHFTSSHCQIDAQLHRCQGGCCCCGARCCGTVARPRFGLLLDRVSWQESQPFQVVLLLTPVEKHISCALPPMMAELKLDWVNGRQHRPLH